MSHASETRDGAGDPPQPRRNRVRDAFFTGVLLAVSCIVAAAIAEAGGRYLVYGALARSDYASHLDLMRPHPTRGWSLVPNTFTQVIKRDYRTGVRTNAQGLRDREHEYAAKPGVFRVLILGDSFMEAQQVPFEESFPCLLEKALAGKNVEVINSGVNGYGSAQELIYLEEEGLKYRPNLVLLSFFAMNDIIENYKPLLSLTLKPDDRLLYSRPYLEWDDTVGDFRRVQPEYDRAMSSYQADRAAPAAPKAVAPWYQQSIFYELYDDARFKREHQSALAKNSANLWMGVYLDDYAPLVKMAPGKSAAEYAALFDNAWNVTDRIILRMRDTAAREGARFAVLLVPAKHQVEAEHAAAIERLVPGLKLALRKPNTHIKAFTYANKIPLCDPLDEFVQANARHEGPLFFNWDDNHWTAKGHQLITATVEGQWDELSGAQK